MLIIADGQGPVAIAGVMGGLDTEVNERTTTILLEDAYFDPVSVRRTSRRLSLPSESSFRFERIVDIEAIDWASKRTAQLITQVAGGKVAKGVVDIYSKKKAKKEVTLRLSRLNKLLGIEVPDKEAVKILSNLGFQPQEKGDCIVCTVPSWRSDVCREIDVIEEVARIYGYDKIPTEQKIKIEVVPVDTHEKLAGLIGTYLNGCGFYETITVGFVDDAVAELFTGNTAREHLGVLDVSRKSANLLRQSLLGSLLGVLKTNLNAKNTPCRIFEIADTFVPVSKPGSLPIEKTKLALVCDGDFRNLRGVIEGLIKSIDRDAQIVFRTVDMVWAEVGAEILINDKLIGAAGIASRKVREKFDFKELSPCGAEMKFEQLMALQRGAIKVKPIPRFPAIERDLSVIVDEKISWSDIIEAVNKKASGKLEEVRFVDIYRGKGIAADKKSVTLSLRFRDEDGTLTHETVDGFEAEIVKSLNKSVGAELRTV
jgi:phenylalanyl-tRNA synthetase beta chain